MRKTCFSVKCLLLSVLTIAAFSLPVFAQSTGVSTQENSQTNIVKSFLKDVDNE